MKDITIAAVSLISRPAEPEKNFEQHLPWIKKAKEQGADLCCFPEMSVTGFCTDYKLFFEASESAEGDATRKMIEAAKQHDIMIGFGMATRNSNDLVGNSYIFVSPEGYLRQIHQSPYPHF